MIENIDYLMIIIFKNYQMILTRRTCQTNIEIQCIVIDFNLKFEFVKYIINLKMQKTR